MEALIVNILQWIPLYKVHPKNQIHMVYLSCRIVKIVDFRKSTSYLSILENRQLQFSATVDFRKSTYKIVDFRKSTSYLSIFENRHLSSVDFWKSTIWCFVEIRKHNLFVPVYTKLYEVKCVALRLCTQAHCSCSQSHFLYSVYLLFTRVTNMTQDLGGRDDHKEKFWRLVHEYRETCRGSKGGGDWTQAEIDRYASDVVIVQKWYKSIVQHDKVAQKPSRTQADGGFQRQTSLSSADYRWTRLVDQSSRFWV